MMNTEFLHPHSLKKY